MLSTETSGRMSATGVRVTVTPRPAGETGPALRICLMPPTGLAEPLDVTRRLVTAVAHALWEARGGDAEANWADAEAAVMELARGLNATAGPAMPTVRVPPAVGPVETGPLPSRPRGRNASARR